MLAIRRTLLVLVSAWGLLLGGCATLQRYEPVNVSVAGVEPLSGEGLEVRMLVKLRVQNPNDLPIDFDGVSLAMDVQGKRFASGVTGTGGTVPRYGETLVSVPMSISVLGVARQAFNLFSSEFPGKITYELSGRLSGPAFGSVRFETKGQLALPDQIFNGG